ncbi:hypothetical protein QYM36_008405 [Artemia franciscana]|uniref:Uncharacterized protein n=1 Tax=Artemia franciscana TaxID=6661 RepID=A0AA88LDX2_ARTSF|nr:hypothetical protein QYM36_008405 [Artemia franciscana]
MWSITEIYGIPVVKFDEEVGGFYRVQTENKFTTFPGYELFETLAVRVTKKHIKYIIHKKYSVAGNLVRLNVNVDLSYFEGG